MGLEQGNTEFSNELILYLCWVRLSLIITSCGWCNCRILVHNQEMRGLQGNRGRPEIHGSTLALFVSFPRPRALLEPGFLEG